jgi:hypothetical protein
MSSKQFNAQRTLRVASVGLLIAGVLAAVWIFVATANTDALSDANSAQARSIQFDQNRREMAEVERLGGKVSVMTVQFHQWFQSLWEGRRLGYTVLVLAVVIAWACRHVAELVDEEHDA